MDVITRADSDDSNEVPNKGDLNKRLAENRSELISAIRESLEDLKVDIIDAVETKVSRAKTLLGIENVKITDLRDAKVEILATTRRNISDAVAPLATKVEMEARFSRIDASHEAINKSHEAINKSIKDLTHFVEEGMGVHEHRLKDQEGPS